MPIALVTGARRGIGLAIAQALEREGYTVVYAARSAEGPDCAAHYIPCDISLKADREHLLAKVLKQFGEIHLLINNAGIAPPERMDVLATTEANYDAVLDVNLRGTFFMCQLFANQMIKQGGQGCRIINIASLSSDTVSVNRGEYCISKAGVSMVTALFAARLAEYGIGVFEVRPGIIRTDMTAAVQARYEAMIADGLTPIKRMGSPEEVADCVLTAASGRLDFATGQVIHADGGFHLRRL